MSRNRQVPHRRGWLIVPPALWFGLFSLLPLAIVFRISLSDKVRGQPPYAPQFEASGGFAGIAEFLKNLDLENYAAIIGDDLYWYAFVTSLRIAAVSTLALAVIGYAMAYAMARTPATIRPALLALMIVPFWTSFLVRIYAWIGILRPEGLLNHVLLSLGVISQPLTILNTEIAIYIGIVYAYLPFMVLPIYAVLERSDHTLIEAAADLGATPRRAFWSITFPLSLPGVLAGCLLVFIPVVGEFVIPDLLGGSDTLMVGRMVWTEFASNRDWPLASALAILLLLVLLPPVLFAQRLRRVEERAAS
ncbi:MAG: ABC transporter permease [Beijerinckiaceae bacterium]